jgi:pyrroline-5-carboxylate reductase
MAEAMISGLLKKELVAPSQIVASGPRPDRGSDLRTRYGIVTDVHNLAAVDTDVLTLSVKPQTMRTVLTELSGRVPPDTLVVSIAAGVPLKTVGEGLGSGRVARAMPNTPGRINRGITVWTATDAVTPAQRDQASLLLGALGAEVFVEDEKYLDMATALSGTGPAYVFLFMESLVDAGVRLGLPRYLAERLVTETVSGSAEYAKETREHLARLRDDVTSPGGTSAEALFQLDEAGFRTAIAKAVHAAYQRSVELGRS